MERVSVQLTEKQLEKIDSLADKHDVSRSVVLRSVIENGRKAVVHHPDYFPPQWDRWKRKTAPELAREGKLP